MLQEPVLAHDSRVWREAAEQKKLFLLLVETRSPLRLTLISPEDCLTLAGWWGSGCWITWS